MLCFEPGLHFIHNNQRSCCCHSTPPYATACGIQDKQKSTMKNVLMVCDRVCPCSAIFVRSWVIEPAFRSVVFSSLTGFFFIFRLIMKQWLINFFNIRTFRFSVGVLPLQRNVWLLSEIVYLAVKNDRVGWDFTQRKGQASQVSLQSMRLT